METVEERKGVLGSVLRGRDNTRSTLTLPRKQLVVKESDYAREKTFGKS